MKHKLHTGIKTVIDTNGKEVLNSVLLSNILADYGAYDDFPTTKVVLKDVLSNGYGKRILESIANDTKSADIAVDNIRKNFEKETKYKKDIVKYVFDSISYGLGIITKIDEPFSKGFDPFADESDGILDSLPDLLATLKREYADSLEKLLVKPEDIVWDAPAYYTASSENKLFLIEGKISVISKQMGVADDWCKKQKASKLSIYAKRKQGAVRELLDSKKLEYSELIANSFITPKSVVPGQSVCFDASKTALIKELEGIILGLYKEQEMEYDKWCEKQKATLINSTLDNVKSEYRELLTKALIIPKSIFISRSAYFDTKYSLEISDKEKLIVALFCEMGEDSNSWCEKEKSNVLRPYVVSRQKQIRQAAFKIVLPLIVLIYAVSQIAIYSSSVEEIERFEAAIADGDKYMDEGQYGLSISAYLAAGENYDGSYRTSHYKSLAIDKADNCFNNLQTNVDIQQLPNKKFRVIKDELASIPQEYLAMDDFQKAWVNTTQDKLVQAADSEVETIIDMISSSNGKLDADGQTYLDELLYISPDNYWLNFIKNKTNE